MGRLIRTLLITVAVLTVLLAAVSVARAEEPRWKVSLTGTSGQVLDVPQLEAYNFNTAQGSDFEDRMSDAIFDIVGGQRNFAGVYSNQEGILNIYSYEKPPALHAGAATISGASVAFGYGDTRAFGGQVSYRIRDHWWVNAEWQHNRGHSIQIDRARDLLAANSVDEEVALFYNPDNTFTPGVIWRTTASRLYETQRDTVSLNSQDALLGTSYQVILGHGLSLNPLVGVDVLRATSEIRSANSVYSYDDPFVELSKPGADVQEHRLPIGDETKQTSKSTAYRVKPYFGIRAAVQHGRWELNAEGRFTVGSVEPITTTGQTVFGRWTLPQSHNGFQATFGLSRYF